MWKIVSKNKKYIILGILLLGVILYLDITRTLDYTPDIDELKDWIGSFGILAPLIFIIITVSTNVIPPLAVTPLWFIGIALFDSPWNYVYIYFANLLGALANYLIARFLGRPVVERFVGKGTLKEVDRFVGISNKRTVFLLRVFGGALTDYISYAMGLSKLSFSLYLSSTALGFLPTMAAALWFIRRSVVESVTLQSVVTSFGWLYIVIYSTTLVVPLIVYLDKRIKK